jgi:hypothetical protein
LPDDEKDSVEFLSVYDEIHSTGTMNERTVPVSPFPIPPLSDNDVVPVRDLSSLGDAIAAGDKA